TRARIGAAACDTARSVDYVGAGTVEFIVSADRPDEFFFMEMNTRLQVEHPVTEMVTGIDLVQAQVRIAAGEPLGLSQEQIRLTGHAVEARVYAEDPGRGFLPTGGTVLDLVDPAGPGVRVDSGLRVGTVVGSDYDPMLSKVIAHGPDRAAALARLDRALSGTTVLGVTANIEFLRFLLADEDVRAGRLDTGLLDRRVGDFVPATAADDDFVAAAAYHWLRREPRHTAGAGAHSLWDVPSGWRVGAHAPTPIRLAAGERVEHVYLTGVPEAATVRIGDGASREVRAEFEPAGPPPVRDAGSSGGARGVLALTIDGLRRTYRVAEQGDTVWVAGPEGVRTLRAVPEVSVRGAAAHVGDAEIRSPMPGSVLATPVASGTAVAAGAPVVVVEAMKMEHTLTAPVDGVVEVLVAAGAQVRLDELLARVVTAPDPETGTADPAPAGSAASDPAEREGLSA